MVEHLTFNQVVVGSIPTRLTKFRLEYPVAASSIKSFVLIMCGSTPALMV